MQPTVGLYVYAAFSIEPDHCLKYKVRGTDFILWSADIIFYLLSIIIKVFLQKNFATAFE